MSCDKEGFIELIRSNIKEFGFHFTIVQQAVEPRFAYTVGCHEVLGFEMIFAGGIYYLRNDLLVIFNKIVDFFKNGGNLQGELKVDDLGAFKFRRIDDSEKDAMNLVVIEYVDGINVDVYQILPHKDHFTLEIPNMSEKWSFNDSIWKWLKEKWTFDAPENSLVVTNLGALLGKKITEIVRWEIDDWEMFAGAGQETIKKDIRVVSLGLMIGIDPSLLPSLELEIEEGIQRDSGETAWRKW